MKRTRGRRGRQRPRAMEATTPHMGRRHIRPACLKAEPNTLGQFVSFESNRFRVAPSRLHRVGTVATVRPSPFIY